jgi:hypothetical protein
MLENKYYALVLDKDGNRWGPFETLAEVVAFTPEKWPDQKQDPHRTGNCWDVMVLEPNEKDKYDPVMKNRTHFTHRIDMGDNDGEKRHRASGRRGRFRSGNGDIPGRMSTLAQRCHYPAAGCSANPIEDTEGGPADWLSGATYPYAERRQK